jgi:PAS domain S-box-containing protein
MFATMFPGFLASFGKRRSRLVVAGGAGALLLLVWWYVLAGIDADRVASAARVERDLANLTRVTQENAVRSFQSAEQLLRLVQKRYAEESERLDLNALAGRDLIDGEIFNLVGIVDAQGNLRLSNLRVEGPVNVADRDYFKAHAAVDSGQMSISAPVLGRASGKWSIQVSRRINLENGDFGGVAFVSLNAAYFTRFYADLDLGKSGVATLVGMDGIVRARRSENQDQYGIDISASPLFEQLSAGLNAGLFTSRSISDGIERTYYFRRVAPYPLAVVTGAGTEEMAAGHQKNREAMLLQASFASLLIVGLAIAFLVREGTLRGRMLASSIVDPGVTEASADAATAPRRKRSLALIFIALALLVPLLDLIVVLWNAPQLKRDAYSSLETIATLKAEAIENWLDERHGDARIIASSRGLIEEIAAFQQGKLSDQDYILMRMQDIRAAYAYANVQLADVHGQVQLSLTAHRHLPAPTRALLDQVVASGQPQLTGLFVDAADSEPQMDVIVPLLLTANGRREAVGALILHIDPRHFLFPYIRHWPTASPSGETLLARRDGDSVLFLNALRHSAAPAMSLRLPLEKLTEATRPTTLALLTRQAGTMDGLDYRGVPILAAFHPVKGTDWHIISKLERDEVFAPLWSLVFLVSLVATAGVGAIGVAMLLLWRQQERARQYEAKTNRLLKHFYELPFIGMAITSPKSRRWLQVNDRLCEILGYSRRELFDKTWAEMTHPDDLAKDVAAFERVLSGESEGYQLDKRFIRKDGSIVHAELAVRCVRRRNGSVDSIVATVQDISERIAAAQEILRSNSELEQFSYSISHDMRQPLRMISSYLQLLEMGLGDQLDKEKREFLDFAVDGAKRLDQMLVALLEYSRVGRKGEPPAWVESRAVLDEALLFLRPAIAEAQADVQLLGDWPRLLVSPDEFLRLLQNLIGNALKFRLPGRLPEIKVSGEVVGKAWHLSVADNGVGIAAGQAGRLFQVFQRLQSRADYEGTGVGLALCRKIVERHGGQVWAESEGEGRGSRFQVVLPLLAEEAGNETS